MKPQDLAKRYQHARAMERETATRIRRLVTALQHWQAEADKLERRMHADQIAELIAQAKVRAVLKRLNVRPTTTK